MCVTVDPRDKSALEIHTTLLRYTLSVHIRQRQHGMGNPLACSSTDSYSAYFVAVFWYTEDRRCILGHRAQYQQEDLVKMRTENGKLDGNVQSGGETWLYFEILWGVVWEPWDKGPIPCNKYIYSKKMAGVKRKRTCLENVGIHRKSWGAIKAITRAACTAFTWWKHWHIIIPLLCFAGGLAIASVDNFMVQTWNSGVLGYVGPSPATVPSLAWRRHSFSEHWRLTQFLWYTTVTNSPGEPATGAMSLKRLPCLAARVVRVSWQCIGGQ